MSTRHANRQKAVFGNKATPSKETLVNEEDAEPPPASPSLAKEQPGVNQEDSEPPGLSSFKQTGRITAVTLNIEKGDVPQLLSPDPWLGMVRRRAAKAVPASLRSLLFCETHFPGVSLAEWNDWRWQLKNRITGLKRLERIIRLSAEEREALGGNGGTLPMAITPYYASLIDPVNPDHPLRRTVVPVPAEKMLSAGESIDPLGEETHSPVPGLVHRYPDRVLFLVTGFCSVNCRYCTRSRIVGGDAEPFGKKQWDRAIEYISQHPEVRDVLVSGGDPLTLPGERLEYLLSRLRGIPHVEIIRIGSKVPVVLPQRITHGLTRMMKRFHPVWMSLHFTHPDEITPEVSNACSRLADAGIPLGSQTVLLKGINDDVPTMRRLMQGLMKIRVKPYYIYQCDPIAGSSHFRTAVSAGLDIVRGLRGHTSGYAVPHYVIDAPGGGGKIPLCPEYVVGREHGWLILKNYEGNLYRYPDEPEAVQ
jgi:lysine 2,3-aminomutase